MYLIEIELSGKKMVAKKSGELRTFANKEKARQFIRNHCHLWENCRIVDKETTKKRVRT